MAHSIVTEAVQWSVMRRGGWTRAARGQYVIFAHIHHATTYQVEYVDDRVSSAAADLGVLGKTYDTQLAASKDAHKAVTLALELYWAREDAEVQILTRHGVQP